MVGSADKHSQSIELAGYGDREQNTQSDDFFKNKNDQSVSHNSISYPENSSTTVHSNKKSPTRK